jgi:hypothetical protein
MDDDNEFRRHLAAALRNACRARSDDEKASWLLLAQGWLGLLRKHPQTDKDAINTERADDSERNSS